MKLDAFEFHMNHRKIFLKKQRGYFVIEAVAVSLLLLAIVTSFHLFHMFAFHRIEEESKLTAVTLAQEQLAYMQDELSNYLDVDEAPWLGSESAPIVRNGQSFSIKTSLAFMEHENARLVTVEVSWETQRGWQTYKIEKFLKTP